MGKNALEDERAIAVCNALRESKVSKIQELDLSSNDIGPLGAESVGAYVAVNGGLTSIDVGHNSIGKEAALSLVSIFKEKDQMKSIGLASCSIDANAAKAVADYVSVSGGLTTVWIPSKPQTQPVAQTLPDGLAQCVPHS